MMIYMHEMIFIWVNMGMTVTFCELDIWNKCTNSYKSNCFQKKKKRNVKYWDSKDNLQKYMKCIKRNEMTSDYNKNSCLSLLNWFLHQTLDITTNYNLLDYFISFSWLKLEFFL